MGAPPRILDGMTLLVCEDQTLTRNLFTRTLTDAGATVLVASDGQEAINHLNGPAADDIRGFILDLILPDIDGDHILFDLRHRRYRAHPLLPVVIISGIDDAASIRIIQSMRITAYQVKPVHPTTILESALSMVAQQVPCR